jgi:microcystin-dependent protein
LPWANSPNQLEHSFVLAYRYNLWRQRHPLQLGQAAGADNVTLTAANLPAHTHALNANGASTGNVPTPGGSVLSNTQGPPVNDKDYLAAGTVTPLAANAVGMTGGSQPVSVVQPYVAMNYIICVAGMFPPRP